MVASEAKVSSEGVHEGFRETDGRAVCGLSQSVSQLFHGPAPRSPLHRLADRLRHSRSNTSTVFVAGFVLIHSRADSCADVLHVGVKRDPTNFSTRAMRVTLSLFLAAAPRSDA